MNKENNSEPIRVLHILQRMEAGGTQALLMNLYRNIDRTKVQFDFLVVYPEKQFYDDEIESLGGKLYYTSLRRDFNILKFEKELKRILLKNKYQIVHVHAYTFGYFALSVAKACGVPVRIAHSHNNETVHDYKWLPKLIMQRLYIRNATDLFACSQAAGEYLFKGASFKILKNAIDSPKFIYNKEVALEVRKELNIPPDTFVVGHVGRFHPQKNHDFLLEVFAKLKELESNSKLILVGSGDLENKIRNKATDLGLTSNVLFLGNKSDMYRIYQAMDVFVLPSLFEGLGIVAIEAQAAGIPCVCSDTVAKDACISPLFSSLSLKEDAGVWANTVVNENRNPYKHKNMSSYIIDNGYDVSSSAIMMQNYYLQSLIHMSYKEVFFVVGSLGGKGWGGAHRVMGILANYLVEKGYPVTIIVWRDSTVDYPLDKRIKIEWLHCEINKELDMMKPCLMTRKILKNHDDAYLFAFMSRMATYAAIYTIGLKVKVIGSERTDPRTEPHKAPFRWVRNHAFGFLYRTVYQTPDAMAYFPKCAQRNGCVILNPISPNLPERYQGVRRKEFVTFCRIDKQKNLPMMIDAFCMLHDRYPDYTLKIYGTGLIEEEIRNYIKEKEADSYIFMMGFAKAVHSSIVDAAGFLSSSDYEGLSNSMLEALAIGMPCVCTDCPIGGAKMVIHDGVNGLLVPVGDRKAMTDAIVRIIEDPELGRKMSAEAEKIKGELDQDAICEKWEKLLYEET